MAELICPVCNEKMVIVNALYDGEALCLWKCGCSYSDENMIMQKLASFPTNK